MGASLLLGIATIARPRRDHGGMYEYTTLRLVGSLTKAVERDWAGILNRYAAEGWRLVTVDASIAFFERQA